MHRLPRSDSAQEKREKEERELAAHRERERIRAGKEMQLALRKEQEEQMRRNLEVGGKACRGVRSVHCLQLFQARAGP